MSTGAAPPAQPARAPAPAVPPARHRTEADRPAPRPPQPGEETHEVLADRPGVLVVRHGDTVVKTHTAGTDREALTRRLRTAAHPALRGVLLPPLPFDDRGTLLLTGADGRATTRWPHGTPVDPHRPEAAPWQQAARLLAGLHTVPPQELPCTPPPFRGPRKVALAVRRMRTAVTAAAGAQAEETAGPAPAVPAQPAHPAAPGPPPGQAPVLPQAAAPVVERAAALLPSWATGAAPAPRADTLCHGDLHLGQLVHRPDGGGWLLIDVDDMGLGDPAWDLARPAAWFAAGLLAPETWAAFLTAYQAAGGTAVHTADDPWPQLDVPARALTVQTAALAVAKAATGRRVLDAVEQVVVDACARMATPPRPSAPRTGSVG
ncbi:phosphotransferase [Streptomyces sp. NPDC059740]|uniref:phosphotransferase n=1 Tax=Streptomyces sp. NPDC059740 TaxID=3346926 RepID=UPI00364F4282